MLAPVLRPLLPVTWPEMITVVFWVKRGPSNRVELVITHCGACRSCLNHATDEAKSANLMGSSINQVANEYRRSFGMTPNATTFSVPHLLEQGFEAVGLTVDIPNYVMRDH